MPIERRLSHEAAGTSQAPDEAFHGRIFLLRHGAIQSPDREERLLGQKDRPLSAEGLRQAAAWADYFATAAPDVLYCSDLARCLETGCSSNKTHPG